MTTCCALARACPRAVSPLSCTFHHGWCSRPEPCTGSYQQAPQLDCLYPAAPQALSGCTVHKDAAIQLALDASHATFMPLPRNTPRQSRHPDLGQITGRSQPEAWCAGANGHTRPTWVVPAAARSLMPSGSMPVSSSRRMCSIQQRTSLKKERVMPTEPQIRSLHASMRTCQICLDKHSVDRIPVLLVVYRATPTAYRC